MPIAKLCFGLGFKEEPLPFGDLRSEMLYELILCCICGGMSPLYRRLYDEGLTDPGFGVKKSPVCINLCIFDY